MASETEDYLRPERHRLITPDPPVDRDKGDLEFSSPQEDDIPMMMKEYKWLLETEFPLALQVIKVTAYGITSEVRTRLMLKCG